MQRNDKHVISRLQCRLVLTGRFPFYSNRSSDSAMPAPSAGSRAILSKSARFCLGLIFRRQQTGGQKAATAVFAPSEDIRNRLEVTGALYDVVLRSHEEAPLNDAPVPRPPRKPKLIDIFAIGAIGAHKGSRVLLNLAREAKARSLPIRHHIVAYSDLTSEMTGAGVTETGHYDSETEAIDRLTKIRPSCVFLPSIWPDTFCFTLSIAFALGIPPVVFDLGAQA